MKMIKRFLEPFIKGFVIGFTMLVPGVSGGSMAMILNIYDRMISAVSNFFKDIKKNILFLGVICLGGGLGLAIGVWPIKYLLEHFPNPTQFFFLGAVAGGVPMIVKKAGIRKFHIRQLLYVVLGGLAVFLITLVPTNIFELGQKGVLGILAQLVAGVVLSVALVLPGISTSHMLTVMGLYGPVTDAIHDLNLFILVPLAVGVVAGIFLTTKLLEKWMTKTPEMAYMAILGFVLFSLWELFPTGFHFGLETIVCAITLVAGFAAILFLSRFDEDEAKAQLEAENT